MPVPVWARASAAVFLMLVIMALSILPGDPRMDDFKFVWFASSVPNVLKKVAHVVCYGGLAWLWFWALAGIGDTRRRLTVAFVVAVGYGAALEWVQTMVPGRYGTLFDVLVNTIGAVAGLAAGALLM